MSVTQILQGWGQLEKGICLKKKQRVIHPETTQFSIFIYDIFGRVVNKN